MVTVGLSWLWWDLNASCVLLRFVTGFDECSCTCPTIIEIFFRVSWQLSALDYLVWTLTSLIVSCNVVCLNSSCLLLLQTCVPFLKLLPLLSIVLSFLISFLWVTYLFITLVRLFHCFTARLLVAAHAGLFKSLKPCAWLHIFLWFLICRASYIFRAWWFCRKV